MDYYGDRLPFHCCIWGSAPIGRRTRCTAEKPSDAWIVNRTPSRAQRHTWQRGASPLCYHGNRTKCFAPESGAENAATHTSTRLLWTKVIETNIWGSVDVDCADLVSLFVTNVQSNVQVPCPVWGGSTALDQLKTDFTSSYSDVRLSYNLLIMSSLLLFQP